MKVRQYEAPGANLPQSSIESPVMPAATPAAATQGRLMGFLLWLVRSPPVRAPRKAPPVRPTAPHRDQFDSGAT